MVDTQEKTEQILRSWQLFKQTDNSRMVNQKALEQAINQIESLTAQLDEARGALQDVIDDLKDRAKWDDDVKTIPLGCGAFARAKQVLSTIRGE